MAKKTTKVPKWIAGIKIPKTVRKGPLGSLLSTPAGQILLAELLVLIGGALATAANPDTKTGRALRMAMNEGLEELKGGTPKKRRRDIGRHLGDGFLRGMEAFRHSMRSEGTDSDLKDVEPLGHGKKKSSKSRPGPMTH